MILFLISLFLVFGFSFCFANILESKNLIKNIIYFLISAFANIVLTFELLSLFSLISQSGVLIVNLVLFATIFAIWLLKGYPIIKFNIREFFERFKNSLELDNSLIFLLSGLFLVLLVSSLVIIFAPSNEAADLFYHAVRPLFWIENGTFNHFNVSDARILSFPINSEILYTWVLLFLKKDMFLRSFSFVSYFLYIAALYGIMSEFTVSLRKRLWVICIASSFTSVITYISSNETNIIVAALISSSIYLLLLSLRNIKKVSLLFMSALAFALAIGVKSSALFILPALVVWYIYVGIKSVGKSFWKIFGRFILFLGINFLIFASYNYILNFLNYGSFISTPSLTYSHQNISGIRGFFFNIINYIIMLFYFPEYDKFLNLSGFFGNLQKDLFGLLGSGFLIGRYSNNHFGSFIISDRAGLGIVGVLAFLPCLALSAAGLCKNAFNKKFLVNSFSLLFLISFIIMAYSVVYMSFNIRFIVTFALVAAPVLYYSYNRNLTFYKFLIILAAFVSLWYVPLNITHNNIFDILKYSRRGYSMQEFHEVLLCGGLHSGKNIYCDMRDYVKGLGKDKKILYFPQEGEALFILKLLQFDGYNIDVDLVENAENIDFNKYDYVIILNNQQSSTLFHNINKLKSGFYRGDEFYCQYNAVTGALVLDNVKSKPYISYCKIQNDFFSHRNFKLFDILFYSESFDNFNSSYMYFVYEQTKNPH